MESVLLRRNLIVKKSPVHGYGVFAGEDIMRGDIIEECYTVLPEYAEDPYRSYTFSVKDGSAMVLGNGCIYNHVPENPHASYEYNEEKSVMTFIALRDIRKGEEIFTNYGDDWFASRNAVIKKPSLRFKAQRLVKSMQSILRFSLVWSGIMLVIIVNQFYFAGHV